MTLNVIWEEVSHQIRLHDLLYHDRLGTEWILLHLYWPDLLQRNRLLLPSDQLP